MNIFALADCNNFFVSCERVFRPHLNKKPVIVLSGNDGCVISRSEEAKALGIDMGVPVFEIRGLAIQHKVSLISANHELYVDCSRRVAQVLRQYAPVVEQYSIDECFLELKHDEHLMGYAQSLRAQVLRWTGIPVSIGLAKTKALAKLASDRAKKRGGVLSLIDDRSRAETLASTPVDGIWGIARRSALRLAPYGVKTAADFTGLEDSLIQKILGIGGVRLAHELRGTSCLKLVTEASLRQSMTVSRSFGQPITALSTLESALATFAAQAAQRARHHGLKAGTLRVFLGWREEGRLSISHEDSTLPATNDPSALIRLAKKLAQRLYREERSYRKAGIILGSLEKADSKQFKLFDHSTEEKIGRLMRAVDTLNATFGSHALHFASESISHAWTPKSEHRSPRWTTRWEDIPRVRVSI
jgi:DNA polymerase V